MNQEIVQQRLEDRLCQRLEDQKSINLGLRKEIDAQLIRLSEKHSKERQMKQKKLELQKVCEKNRLKKNNIRRLTNEIVLKIETLTKRMGPLQDLVIRLRNLRIQIKVRKNAIRKFQAKIRASEQLILKIQKYRFREIGQLANIEANRIFNIRNIGIDIYTWHETLKPEIMFTIISHILHVTKVVFDYAGMFTIHQLQMKGSKSSIHNVRNDLIYKCYELNYRNFKKQSLSTVLYMLNDMWILLLSNLQTPVPRKDILNKMFIYLGS